jgi:hypothetical protein
MKINIKLRLIIRECALQMNILVGVCVFNLQE